MDDVLQSCKTETIAGVIIDISASENTFDMSEFMESSAYVESCLPEDVPMVIGARYDESLCNSMMIIGHVIVRSRNGRG
jgi:cell division GTPase FtsZ